LRVKAVAFEYAEAAAHIEVSGRDGVAWQRDTQRAKLQLWLGKKRFGPNKSTEQKNKRN
jgi:hypothetical protein